jgi:hypothetical protein
MTSYVRDRLALLIAASVVGISSVIIGMESHALGFGEVEFLLVIETVCVFGAALSYWRTAWPKWLKRPGLRKRIFLALAFFLALPGLLKGKKNAIEA